MDSKGLGKPRTARPTTGVGGSAVGPKGVFIMAVLLLGAAVLFLYSLWAFWPPAATASQSAPNCDCRWFGIHFSLERERSILLIVALAGALGAMLHGLRSFARYVGERYFFRSWILYYLALPIVGALLGTIVYLVLRAGLISGSGASQDPFGFAAVAALVGLFSGQAAEKLKQVFETLFTAPRQGADSVPPPAPTISQIDPASAAAGTTVTITGSNFVAGQTDVRFGDFAGTNVTVAQDGASLTVLIPQGLGQGPVNVTITTLAGTATAKMTIA